MHINYLLLQFQTIKIKQNNYFLIEFSIFSGQRMNSLRFSHRISQPALSKIIPETIAAIIHVLFERYVKFPSTVEQWTKISKDFEELWGFPHVLGAIDGLFLIL